MTHDSIRLPSARRPRAEVIVGGGSAAAEQLLRLTSAVTHPTPEVTNLRGMTASALIEDY
ncbi:hypothetical protein RCH12_002972 [Cryobacterium sp. MP_3.1]|uniref:hypothetical protein n=1 Tax=Cryobacterium sp. MP_3.1 TaxID=3071711 RepID=UPI002E00E2B8|nr:hypothetical protein [Cryobacterium sp. MP_3.1]